MTAEYRTIVRLAPKWTEFPKYPVTAGTVVLAIGVTIAWWSKVDISPLFETAMIRRGEFWRPFTSAFPHTGIFHLAFNVYWTWVFGTVVEEVYGHLRTAAVFALFAFGSGTFEFALAAGGVGLSGVGYGLFGLLWILSSRDDRFHDAVDQRTVRLFLGWFVLCVATTVLKIFPVANIAHAAGAVLGILLGVAITIPNRRTQVTVAIIVLIIFGVWGSTGALGVVQPLGYGTRMRKSGGEDEALESGQNKEAVRWLKDAVIYQPKLAVYWFDLGIGYERLGNTSAARTAYQHALDLAPGNGKYSEAMNGLK